MNDTSWAKGFPEFWEIFFPMCLPLAGRQWKRLQPEKALNRGQDSGGGVGGDGGRAGQRRTDDARLHRRRLGLLRDASRHRGAGCGGRHARTGGRRARANRRALPDRHADASLATFDVSRGRT